MTQPTPAPAPTPPAPTPAPAAPPVPGAPAPAPAPAPTYVPPANLAPPAPAPGPVYTPPVPVPPAPAEPDDGSRDLTRLPQWVQDQVRQLKDENAQRRIEARTAVVNQHAQYAALQLGANPAALLGSTAFAGLAVELNPHAPDFPAKLTAAIQATIAANPWMAAAPAPPAAPAAPAAPVAPPTSGADFSAGSGAGTPITEAQLAQMTPQQIEAAFNAGQLKHLM